VDSSVPIITRRKPQTSFHPTGKRKITTSLQKDWQVRKSTLLLLYSRTQKDRPIR